MMWKVLRVKSIAGDPSSVAFHADWPVNEIDLLARHSWLVRQTETLRDALSDPDFYDVKIAGWCSGNGPWVWDGEKIGWKLHKWTARKGYALTDEAKENSASETVWASPHCLHKQNEQGGLFA